MGWVSRGGGRVGGVNEQLRRAVKRLSLCGIVWGVVGLLTGGGVRSLLSPAWCPVLPDEEEPELIVLLSFLALGHRWPWGVHPRSKG